MVTREETRELIIALQRDCDSSDSTQVQGRRCAERTGFLLSSNPVIFVRVQALVY
jgi:hypothetical protein